MGAADRIEVETPSLEFVFFERLQTAPLPDEVKVYLTLTLVGWVTSPPKAESLALAWLMAQEVDNRFLLREVGDKALYLAGTREDVSQSYVCTVGSSAFSAFASQVRTPVYWALAERFEASAEAVRAAMQEPT